MTAVVLKGTMAVCVLGPRYYHGKQDKEDRIIKPA